MKYYYRVTDNEKDFKVNAPADYSDATYVLPGELVRPFSCEVVGLPDAIVDKNATYTVTPRIWLQGVGQSAVDVTNILLSGALVLNWVRKNPNGKGKGLENTDKAWAAANKGKKEVQVTHKDVGVSTMHIGFWFDDREATRIYNEAMKGAVWALPDSFARYLEGITSEGHTLNIAKIEV